jgi:hypothetical protein
VLAGDDVFEEAIRGTQHGEAIADLGASVVDQGDPVGARTEREVADLAQRQPRPCKVLINRALSSVCWS